MVCFVLFGLESFCCDFVDCVVLDFVFGFSFGGIVFGSLGC